MNRAVYSPDAAGIIRIVRPALRPSNLAKPLNLNPSGTVEIATAGDDPAVPAYIVDLLLSDKFVFNNGEVLEITGETDFDFIIGMNILNQGNTAISNAAGETAFSVRVPPDARHID
jgi:hypothetical protein